MDGLKRTPLFPCYGETEGARCIDFGGWELPVQFSGIQAEHEAVRRRAGLFDVSHMGEFLVTGPQAEQFLQRVTVNDVSRLLPGQAQYTLMCYPEGGVVDDLLIYRLGQERFMLVVNASNIGKDFQWLESHLPDAGDAAVPAVELTDCSDATALLALQGPAAARILARVTDAPAGELAAFHFVEEAHVCGVQALISRTGYTGEDGFELYLRAEDAAAVWRGLLAAGKDDGLVPVGLGARDTLRFEARLPLYGQELSREITPLEAGLGIFVKLDKGDFIGREALLKQKEAGLPRKLTGIEMLDRGIPRSHYPVYAGPDGEQIGEVTTGTQSPTLKRNVGLALLKREYSAPDTEVWVEIRGKRLKAQVVKTPFYKRGAAE
ncbi:glycine cleavage system aminomethyltransferase GcvT [Paenibacillus sp. YN15]|uniref:glycine cleavage system aminomethyltransferase GcvT n=1 Tax=Paenibacillus sp. YN15 TaxID=1742774 RepID=UPI000DCCD5C5|nr:glycine cleavage system aminomethyltransferase GcvT [Paenibacillus sp. YN15]RAV01764.1 glycine cleavage system aminomethyltransferase GcvT [Paenibacillus sp. YN15]